MLVNGSTRSSRDIWPLFDKYLSHNYARYKPPRDSVHCNTDRVTLLTHECFHPVKNHAVVHVASAVPILIWHQHARVTLRSLTMNIVSRGDLFPGQCDRNRKSSWIFSREAILMTKREGKLRAKRELDFRKFWKGLDDTICRRIF